MKGGCVPRPFPSPVSLTSTTLPSLAVIEGAALLSHALPAMVLHYSLQTMEPNDQSMKLRVKAGLSPCKMISSCILSQ